MSQPPRALFSRMRASLNARLIAVMAAVVLLSLLATNAAAFLILRAQLDRQSDASLRQGQHAASLVLSEWSRTLDNLVVVLSQRPTLRRLLAEGDSAALEHFLEAFRTQSNLDWVVVCDDAENVTAAAGALEPSSCSGLEPGFVPWRGAPILVARSLVTPDGATDDYRVLAGQTIDSELMQQLVSASGVQHSIFDGATGGRLISTWPAPADVLAALPLERRLQPDVSGAEYDTVHTSMDGDRASLLWIESALPVSERLSAERRTLALLALSSAISALVVLMVAVAGVRRANAPLTAALRRSEDAVSAAQAERIAALEWLDALIQSIIEGVILTDGQGVVRLFSAGAERILRLSSSQAEGCAIERVLVPADGSLFPTGALLDNPARTEVIELRTHDGTVMIAAVGATHVSHPSGDGSLNAYLVRDVTDQEAHNRLRSYFLASISHEFRTPLSTLRASLELLVNDENPLDSAEMRQLLRPAYLSVVGLQTLVDNLLTSSTIEAGHFTLHLDDVDMSLLLADAVRVVTPMLERRQQTLVVELPALRPIVRGDAAQLTQTLINLLTNAAKYSPTGASIEAIVETRGAGDGTNVLRVSVADEGPGIAPEQRAEIFRRFVRHHDNEREQYGVGLGLYVAKTTITAHGGRIDVDDRPGGGSIFWFEVP